MDDYLKESIKDLISLRTSLITVVIIITSGTFGLLFIPMSPVKLWFLALIGAYFDAVFLNNIFSMNSRIDDLLRRLKHG